MKVVDYYIKMYENGINSKNLMEELIKAQDEIKSLKSNSKKTETKLERQLKRKQEKLQETK